MEPIGVAVMTAEGVFVADVCEHDAAGFMSETKSRPYCGLGQTLEASRLLYYWGGREEE